jgi:hypothetical protein
MLLLCNNDRIFLRQPKALGDLLFSLLFIITNTSNNNNNGNNCIFSHACYFDMSSQQSGFINFFISCFYFSNRTLIGNCKAFKQVVHNYKACPKWKIYSFDRLVQVQIFCATFFCYLKWDLIYWSIKNEFNGGSVQCANETFFFYFYIQNIVWIISVEFINNLI